MTIEDMIREIVKDEFHKLEVEVQEKVFNVSEAAQYLRISKDWLYKNMSKIPHVDIGGYKFLKSNLDSYIKERTTATRRISIREAKGIGNDFRVE
ncbi:MAG: helix-turn-helix domain-containing protein [Clostridium celatum]|nr:helix-turn-helix domain-containing protein [Clostridium celatum]